MSTRFCCCCDALCPDDGDDGPCALNSLKSAYSIGVSAAWTGSNPAGATSASLAVDAGTHTTITTPLCKKGGSQNGSSWGYRARQWKSPNTSAFPAVTVDIDWAGTVGGSCSTSGSALNNASLNGNPGNLSSQNFDLRGLVLYHEFDCSVNPTFSMWYYVYASTYTSSPLPLSECNIGVRAFTAEICFYTEPTTSCSVSPEQITTWKYQPPVAGTLAARSQLLSTITQPATMFYNCYVTGNCSSVGGSGAPSTMSIGIGIT